MNRLILCLCISLINTVVVSQSSYQTIKSIKYYPEASYKNDSYKDSMCVLDLYYPEGVKNFATIVWFHGGGITGGHRDLPEPLKNKGYAIATVEYRLSPKVKAPAYIEDAAAAVAWVFQHIKQYGGSEQLIFLSGHSAGGYLASMVTLNKAYLEKYNIDANRVAALIPFSGQAITHFTVRQERGIGPLQPVIDSMAPLYFVRKDAPPTILITGDRELELFGRYEENAYWYRMMKLAGHKQTKLLELDGYDHGNMPEGAYPLLLKEMQQRIKEINAEKK
ncbi:MAG: alpha/beta hydrolase fold domain-containing protein [Niabella sp.]